MKPPRPENSRISSNFMAMARRESPRMSALMTTFSRPVNSGWKPAPSSINEAPPPALEQPQRAREDGQRENHHRHERRHVEPPVVIERVLEGEGDRGHGIQEQHRTQALGHPVGGIEDGSEKEPERQNARQ